ncbi:MAG TPA: phosphoribosylformylglycinamidine synthase subunit PurL [Oculatellaceae cyanobacterium]
MSASVANATPITETLKRLNLTEAEYQKICVNLGREPNFNELAMFSVLWSEHCCYKNSRHLLKTLPSKGPRVLHGPGENAGVVDIGDGIQVAFKIESHNHPTAVEPFQGAATGVGGILRDIFTMNARPVANLNALRFGPIDGDSPQQVRNRYLLSGAVSGIAHYGNCVGVPTVGGEIFFDECYSGNPLVNAMAVGVLYNNNVMSAKAMGVGNPVLYVGSATGKDGMGGAAFASKELDENSGEDRPAVQVGDPFAEKLLIEACLEAFATGCVVAAQDMGAAGLTSSSCEMAAKGNVGMCLDLDKVPAREPDMQPWEYLLSESQERMLFVLEKGKEQPVLDVFAKWRIPAVIIGEVTDDQKIRFYHQGKLVVDVPAKLLTDLAPSYDRGKNPPESESAKALRTVDPRQSCSDIQLHEVSQWLIALCGSTNIANPSGIFSQYDRHVQNNTVLASENLGAGVIRLRKEDGTFSGKALAVTVDCNARYVYLEPYQGTMAAVAQAVRNLVCTGAEPLAVSDNLNFGNPEKPEIYYQLYYAVQGIKDACEAFKMPVISGNVSLYNEHSGAPIYPTPTIAMVGLIEDERLAMSPNLAEAGLKLALVGRFKPTLGGSEIQKHRTGKTEGPPPTVDLNSEFAAMQSILKMIREQKVQAVQDVSLGGLLVTLSEMAFAKEVGVKLSLSALRAASLTEAPRLDEVLFGETAGTYVVAYRPDMEPELKASCGSGVAFAPFGETVQDFSLQLDEASPIDLKPVKEIWSSRLAKL